MLLRCVRSLDIMFPITDSALGALVQAFLTLAVKKTKT